MTLSSYLTSDKLTEIIYSAASTLTLDVVMNLTGEFIITDELVDSLDTETLDKLDHLQTWSDAITDILIEVVPHIPYAVDEYSFPEQYIYFKSKDYLDTVLSTELGKTYWYTLPALIRSFDYNVEDRMVNYLLECMSYYIIGEITTVDCTESAL
jgi:hypothetical protein